MCLLGRLVIYAAFIYTLICNLLDTLTQVSSLAKVTRSVNDCISLATIVYTLWLIMLKRPKILDLLKRSNQTWITHVVFTLIGIPFVAVNIKLCMDGYFAGNSHQIIRNICIIGMHHLRTFLLMVYLEITSSLKEHCRLLHSASMKPLVKMETLVIEKWAIRDEIHMCNSLFAMPLSLLYVQIFLRIIVSLNYLFTGTLHIEPFVYIVGQAFYLTEVFIVAQRSSELTAYIYNVERNVFQKSRKILLGAICLTPSDDLPLQCEVLCFNEKWDSLRVGFYVHSQGTFVAFLVTSVTCIAVVLQFDFKIVQIIKDLADRVGENTP